jgi:hypothetical protein
MPDLLEAVLGGLVGGVVSGIGVLWKLRQELAAAYDKDLRAERLRVYSELWKLLRLLSKYAKPAAVTSDSLRKLSADLTHWYFEVGGLFMSEGTRDCYFALQDALDRRIDAGREHPDRVVTDEEFEQLRRKGSRLRTATTLDVGSRRKPLLSSGEAA